MEPNQDTSQLDPSIVALMHGLKTSEGTNGNYNQIGDKGTAAGIGQWSNDVGGKPQPIKQGDIPANFKNMASQYGLNPNDFSPENQNKVLYNSIAADKKSGLSPEQILSKWNSGDSNKYLNPATSTGTGPVGQYDVSAYVKKAMAAAQAYAKQNKQQSSSGLGNFAPQQNQPTPAIQPTSPSTQQDQTPSTDKGFLGNLFSGNIAGAGKNAMDFAFPIISDAVNDIQGKNQKTALQQIGDAGLSALWFVPGFGEGTGLLGHILEGAGIGYGAGTLNKLSSGSGLVSAVTPNASNLIGAATGGIAGGALSKLSDFLGKNFTQEGAINAVQDNLEKTMRGTKSGANFLDDLQAKGSDPMGLITKENAIPDIIDGKINTQAASKVVGDNLGKLGQLRASALDQSGVRGSLPILKNQILDTIDKSMSGTARTSAMDLTNKEFDSLTEQYGKQPSAATMETIKEYLQGRGNYEMATPSITTNAYRTMATTARQQMEDIAEKSGIPDIGKFNKLISQHYDALDALDKMNNQTVKGGRLGNMLRGHTIAGVSAVAAESMGGGILGTLGGALGGEGANALLSKVIGDTQISNPIRDAILKRIETENPDIVSKLQEYLASKGSLPQGLGGDVAAQLAPKATGKLPGLISRTLVQAAGRGGATIGSGTGQ